MQFLKDLVFCVVFTFLALCGLLICFGLLGAFINWDASQMFPKFYDLMVLRIVFVISLLVGICHALTLKLGYR